MKGMDWPTGLSSDLRSTGLSLFHDEWHNCALPEGEAADRRHAFSGAVASQARRFVDLVAPDSSCG